MELKLIALLTILAGLAALILLAKRYQADIKTFFDRAPAPTPFA